MKLTDNEKRDILNLIQEGKDLPEKYRFILFGDEREIELVWNGKNCDITNVVLPFQIIEHIDEPRLEEELVSQPELFDLSTGRQLKGWTNKLIWGDNKYVLSSLKNGPFREEIEKEGGIKLHFLPNDSTEYKEKITISINSVEEDSPMSECMNLDVDTWEELA